MILALDPGTELTAYTLLEPNTDALLKTAKIPNGEMRDLLRAWGKQRKYQTLACEGMQSFGANIGRTVLDTCTWIGRFLEVSGHANIWPVFRPQVLVHHTGKMKGGDSAIRKAMIARYGSAHSKARKAGIAISDKDCPLYGVSADMWSSLAIASFVSDLQRKGITCPTKPECMTQDFNRLR